MYNAYVSDIGASGSSDIFRIIEYIKVCISITLCQNLRPRVT